MFDVTKIGFQRLKTSDLPLMHRWYNTEHVIQWYCKHPLSYEEAVAKCMPRITGEVPTQAFLIMYDAAPQPGEVHLRFPCVDGNANAGR